jgi:hypothetical protein
MTFVCITGMHRSGTSLTARAMHLLGLDLGRHDRLLTATEDNPSGYWENERFVQLDDQLLGSLGGWWHQPPVFGEHWQYGYELEPFRTWGAQLVADHLATGPLAGFKDPRLCLLLPFWRTVVDIDRTVLCLRDPRAVGASLSTRDGFSPEWSAYLWLRYTVGAVHNAPGSLIVTYEDWFDDPHRVVERIIEFVGVTHVETPTTDVVEAAFERDLRRSPTGNSEKPGHQMRLALAVFGALTACERVDESVGADVAVALAQWQGEPTQ